MKRSLGLFIIGALLLSLLAACNTKSDKNTQEPIKIKVGVFNYVSSAPFFIARDEGYFAEQGLEVELIDFGSSSNEMLPAVLDGSLDAAGYSMSVAIFNAILQGGEVKFVADKGFQNPENCTTDAWVASAAAIGSGLISGVESLKDKRVAFPLGTTTEFTLDLMLDEAGLTQDDIVYSNVSDSAARVEAVKNNSIDLTFLSEPWVTKAVESGVNVWMPVSQIVPGMSSAGIIFGPTLLKVDPAVGQAFLVAYLKAVQQFNEGKTERNVEIIANFTKLSPEDIKASCWTSFKSDGLIDTAYLEKFQDWEVSKGLVDGEVQLSQVWTSEYIDAALKDFNKK